MNVYSLVNSSHRKPVNLALSGDEERDAWVRFAQQDKLTDAGARKWREKYPEDWTRVFSEFHSGVLWPMLQETIGVEYTAGMIILYTDKTNVLKHLSCWPIYSK